VAPKTPQPEAERSDRIAALRALTSAEPGDATAHFLLGRELLAVGDPVAAAQAFAAAVRAEPDYTAAWRQWGGALAAAGRNEEADEAWRHGIEVANRTQDVQTGREMIALRKRLARDHGIPDGD